MNRNTSYKKLTLIGVSPEITVLRYFKAEVIIKRLTTFPVNSNYNPWITLVSNK